MKKTKTLEFEASNSFNEYDSFWLGTINSDSIYKFSEDKKLFIHINSMGGDLATSYSLFQRILKHKKHSTSICYGNAQSGGTLIFISAKERIASPSDVFLFHRGHTSNAMQNIEFMQKNYLENMANNIVKRLCKISNKNKEYWSSIIKNGNRDYLFTGKDFKKMGIVTKYL